MVLGNDRIADRYAGKKGMPISKWLSIGIEDKYAAQAVLEAFLEEIGNSE